MDAQKTNPIDVPVGFTENAFKFAEKNYPNKLAR